ncbi:MAG TPA: TolC family protein, partial [Polyangiaceae bacterium]|nr:TolC family protein [Polyangiaceae bacterium]
MNDARVFRAIGLLLTLAPGALAQAPAPAPAPSTPAPEIGPHAPGKGLDLQTVIQRTLQNNPSLRSAELDAVQARQAVLIEEGRYPYVFQADGGYTRSTNARLSTDDSVRSSTSRAYTLGTALRRTFPFGTSAEVRVQGERIDNDSDDITGLR